MQYISRYNSPLGEIILAANDKYLTGLWFKNQKYYLQGLDKNYEEKENEVLRNTKRWLDLYFKGQNPSIEIPIHLTGTSFQLEVWEILCTIPYGKTMTYKEVAEKIAEKRTLKKMSAQAVGGAIGKNKISIIIPCHRVVGTNGNLTGYAGGIDRKRALLKIESENNHDKTNHLDNQ